MAKDRKKYLFKWVPYTHTKRKALGIVNVLERFCMHVPSSLCLSDFSF